MDRSPNLNYKLRNAGKPVGVMGKGTGSDPECNDRTDEVNGIAVAVATSGGFSTGIQ
jgi:hypothetical protein